MGGRHCPEVQLCKEHTRRVDYFSYQQKEKKNLSLSAGKQLRGSIFSVSFSLAIKQEYLSEKQVCTRGPCGVFLFFFKLVFTFSGSFIVAAESGEWESKRVERELK